jgi:hypothetical protein
MSSRTGGAITAPRTRRPPPPGMASRYEAGASLRCLARRYRMSARTVRAYLVVAGVQIRPPGRRKQTAAHSAAPVAGATATLPAGQETPVLATVHLLRPRPRSQHESPEQEPLWPPFDLDRLFTPLSPNRPRQQRPASRASALPPRKSCTGSATPR